MSNKRQQQCELEETCCCPIAAKRLKQEKKHLYLILDDWETGYSVYKVDVDASDDAPSDDARPPESSPFPLPEPPVVCFEARHGRSWYFASHGTKILAMQPSPYPAFPVLNVQTTALAVCPWSRRGGNELVAKPLFASVASSLYLLRGGQFDTLGVAARQRLPPPPPDVGWSWSRVGAPPSFDHCDRVWASALHPDGRTLFVSHERRTFFFDTESREWASHDDWFLPFKGEGYFDAELDAWVGVCCHDDGRGYLCCCDVAPVAGELRSLPAWKLGRDQLFDAGSRRHLGV